MTAKKKSTRAVMHSSRGARTGECKTCKGVVLIGPSDDLGAFMARVDPTPLSPVGEFIAHATGRRTYERRRHGRGVRLYQRDRWQIAGRPAGSPKLDVVADHACGQARLPSIPSAFTPVAPRGVTDEHPPF